MLVHWLIYTYKLIVYWYTLTRNGLWVVLVGRIDKIIGLFCRISALWLGSFAKKTYKFIDPTNQSHPIYDTVICTYGKGVIYEKRGQIWKRGHIWYSDMYIRKRGHIWNGLYDIVVHTYRAGTLLCTDIFMYMYTATDTGCRRLIGYLKSRVIFRKRALSSAKEPYLPQKSPIFRKRATTNRALLRKRDLNVHWHIHVLSKTLPPNQNSTHGIYD